MQENDKNETDENGNVKKDEDNKPRDWTKEEMEEAEPAPMPEVDDEDDDDDDDED